VARGEVGTTFTLTDRRELRLDALQRCPGAVRIALFQRRPGLVELGPYHGRRLHRAGVVVIEHLGHAPQGITRLRGFGDQAHRREGDYQHRRSHRDRAEQGIPATDRLAGRVDHLQGPGGVYQVTERLGMNLAAPRRQDARQFLISIVRCVPSLTDQVQQRVIGLYCGQINRHLMGILVGVASTGKLVSTRH
jgi:hypothetical protein